MLGQYDTLVGMGLWNALWCCVLAAILAVHATPVVGTPVGRTLQLQVAEAEALGLSVVLSHASWVEHGDENAPMEEVPAVWVVVSHSGQDVAGCGGNSTAACASIAFALNNATSNCTNSSLPVILSIVASDARCVRRCMCGWVGLYCLTWRVSGGLSCQVPYHTLHRASSLFRDVARRRQHHSRWNTSTVQRVGTCRHVRRASSVARVPVRYGDNGRAPVGLPCRRSWPVGHAWGACRFAVCSHGCHVQRHTRDEVGMG